MKLRNINPLGQVDVPLLYRQGDPFGEPGAGCLEPGEEFDVTEDQARQLLPQGDNYAPADAEAQELLQLLGPVGVPDVHTEPEQTHPGTGQRMTAVPPGSTITGDGEGDA